MYIVVGLFITVTKCHQAGPKVYSGVSVPSFSWLNRKWCESHGPGSFAPGHKNSGFVLQYLLNEAINHIAVFSQNNVILRDTRYNIQRCD